MMPVGASGKDLIIIILFALLLYVLVTSSGATAPANLPQPTSTSSEPENGPTFVNIKNTDPRVEKAVVHIVGTPQIIGTSQPIGTPQIDDLDHGVLSLPICAAGQQISVWAPGYYLQMRGCDGTTMVHDVTLQPVDETDNTDYGWTGAQIASKHKIAAVVVMMVHPPT